MTPALNTTGDSLLGSSSFKNRGLSGEVILRGGTPVMIGGGGETNLLTGDVTVLLVGDIGGGDNTLLGDKEYPLESGVGLRRTICGLGPFITPAPS